MTRLMVAVAAATLLVGGAQAAPVYSTSVVIGYDPTALTSNFAAPGTKNSETAYTVRTGIDSQNYYVDVTATPPSSAPVDQFANIYLGGLTFSPGLIFEVTNDRVSTTTNPGGYYSLAGTGFTYAATTNDISFVLPLSFLETDPLGIGFTKVSPGDEIRVSYAQAFGYSFVGGTANFGQARLGEQYIPAATAVPEPLSAALLAGPVVMALSTRRRTRA